MIKSHTISFKNALRGLRWALSTQPNFKIHITLSTVALAGAYFFSVSYTELLIIFTFITVGLTLEVVNTAFELTTDAIDMKWRKDIGLAKDVAAGAMLIFSLMAVIASCIIFVPKIIGRGMF